MSFRRNLTHVRLKAAKCQKVGSWQWSKEEVWALGLTQVQGREAANKKLVFHPRQA